MPAQACLCEQLQASKQTWKQGTTSPHALHPCQLRQAHLAALEAKVALAGRPRRVSTSSSAVWQG